MARNRVVGVGIGLLALAALVAWRPWGHGATPPAASTSASSDRILVDKLTYVFGGPRHWDLVVFRDPFDPTGKVIKRVDGSDGAIEPTPTSGGR